MKHFKPIFLLVAFCSFALLSCKKDCLDHCTVTKKDIRLDGRQEVPARDTRAKGKAEVTYNKCDKTLTYSISWSNLTGVPTGAHIHGPAPRGQNASIKHDFFNLIPKTSSGTFTNSVKLDDTAIKEDSLLGGYYYFNFHSAKFPGGEIRGQIEF